MRQNLKIASPQKERDNSLPASFLGRDNKSFLEWTNSFLEIYNSFVIETAPLNSATE